uniref:Insulin-like peptide 02 n=1 Tax=Exaiptasia diaphana TaxID=2652724 RepID=INS2_EXADI
MFYLTFLLFGAICIGQIQLGQPVKFKVNEDGHRPSVYPIKYRVCGWEIFARYLAICHIRQRRRKRSIEADIITDKDTANSYFNRVKRGSGRFNIVEECCLEGCIPEEIREYCP